jgi:hypothetical protein
MSIFSVFATMMTIKGSTVYYRQSTKENSHFNYSFVKRNRGGSECEEVEERKA